MKTVVIFGSTGSVGRNALGVIRKKRDEFKVKGLCAHSDIRSLFSQIREFSPSSVCVVDEKKAKEARKVLGRRVKVYGGQKGLDDFGLLTMNES